MTCIFITFASHANYIDAGKRLLKQANDTNLFTNTILYTPENLKEDTEFWNKHSAFINTNKRGYGYWLWKSYIIKKTMENMNEGDILLYLDCGCEIDNRKINKLIEHIDIVKKNNIKIIDSPTSSICLEKYWCKMDLIETLKMNDEMYLNTPQRQAGALLILICNETLALVNEWYNIGCNYHNIDDSPSILPNLPGFKEHRHDQSIFSLLSKKYKLYNSKYSLRTSIDIMRNKTGISKIVI
jgi:hypothetical protein